VKPKAIPDHVAAYAAGLRVTMSWVQVAEAIEAMGMGAYHFGKLATAAQSWERAHLTPAALRRARDLGYERRHKRRAPR
jgi:hypothetical protein